jgi:hypothetical protein
MNELHSIGIRDKKILNPKNTQTFEKMRNQKKEKILWRCKRKVCIVKNTMAIAQSSELKFQWLFEHRPF